MSLRTFIAATRIDPERARDEIEEEFAHHIAAIERELCMAGHAPDRAMALARQRFGDTRRLAESCQSVLLREQTMSKRIHLAITIALGIALIISIGITWTMVNQARRSMEVARMEAAMAMNARMEAEAALQEASRHRAVANDSAKEPETVEKR
ncbi:MAG: hypothetical protein IT435_15135 [Phycisphaerales bacterium]|nr:hypothetical protein [Phycisphaerales bacterium]